jgi:hypothetical protein
MLGARGFDWDRLFREPDFRRFSEAAVASLSRETAAPLCEALGRLPAPSAVELAAFASAFQGVAPRIAALADVEALPAELAEFLGFEARQSAARGGKLLETCGEVSSALSREGLEAVALKGAALLLGGVVEPGLRPMADLDLLLSDPGKMERATRALGAVGWRPRFETRRHLVFGRDGERVVRPGCEDPENPIRVELHYDLRLPVLGRVYDISDAVLAGAEPVEHDGTRTLVAAGNALRRHLLVHAAEDFAAAGLRGIQAHDFRLLSRREGPLHIALSEADRKAGLAPLAHAARAIEKLFPQSFAPEFLARLCDGVPGVLLERADRLGPLRKTRPPRGGTRAALSLIEAPAPKARFLLRSVFPPPGEVKVNVAPEASGVRLAAAWLHLFAMRAVRLLGRRQRDPGVASSDRVLQSGELRFLERFGPATTNRGAVLVDCEWDGGVFEAGVMLGGVFRSGSFQGGVFWSGLWKGGVWEKGLWHSGFGPDGRYRPRDAPPGLPITDPVLAGAPAAEREGGVRLTVFAASVFPDVVRLWHACLVRALPPSETIVEVYDDSADEVLDASFLPGATLLRRTSGRPDFQCAYNDALARATTPLLAFVDTDVFWVSRELWARVLEKLERREVAAVSCVSREGTGSPGTFAVVMKVAAYRDALRSVPGGFLPFAEREASGPPPGRWIGHDTGDLAARAVRAAGFEVELLHLERQGDVVRFDAITNTRLIRSWTGEGPFLGLAVRKPYFRRGALGNLALHLLHDHLFKDGPRYVPPVPADRLWRALVVHPRTFVRAIREWLRIREGTRKIGEFLAGP